MSAISVGCEEAYKTSVDVTCDSVDSSIKVITQNVYNRDSFDPAQSINITF